MTHATEIHHRALAAATAVVGRERHRLGRAALGLLLAAGPLACLPDKDDGADASATAPDPGTGTSTSLTDPSTGALSDATTADTTATDTTDTTLVTTGTGTTGDSTTTAPDTTTGDSTTAAPDTTTGDLDACIGPDGRVDWVCCEAQGWQPAPQCTPWGPPAPPRFDARPARGRLC